MTDLVRILPAFDLGPFAALVPAIEHHALTTANLLSLHPADVAKQTGLPLLDLRRFVALVRASLVQDLVPDRPLLSLHPPLAPPRRTIGLLDHELEAALAGGVPLGCITEFVGESGAGKTQFLLSLCLAVQLPPPQGPGRKAVYLSTESGLATHRLAQIIASNRLLNRLHPRDRPSLDNIFTAATPDLESQDHILQYQVPVLLARHNIGLLVIDSVAANFRAEFERQPSHGSNMAARSADLVRLGALLRDLARRHNLAVVVANQVADRFSSTPAPSHQSPVYGLAPATQESPLASRTLPILEPPPSSSASSVRSCLPEDKHLAQAALRLDHQQRWFTGWGDDPFAQASLKTPSLGLVWSTQISCRLALLRQPASQLSSQPDGDPADGTPSSPAWTRWMKVVFAPHAPASGPGLQGAVEFVISTEGISAAKASA